MNENTKHALEKLYERSGQMAVEDANVEMVRIERVRVVRNTIPRAVRKGLNAAVKAGTLGHMKKDGPLPEVYYHPTFEYLAHGARRKALRDVEIALLKVCA